MVFLMLSTLLALHNSGSRQENALKAGIDEATAFRKTSDKFANIRNNTVVLTKNDAEREIDARILPFNYTIDGNRFSLASELPARQERVDAYLETINAFRVFLEDTNHAREYDSIKVDINTLTPASWGGTDRNASFTIRPQCIRYSIIDSNLNSLEFTCPEHGFSAVKRIDMNVVLGAQDFNSIACSFNGASTCFNIDYNSLDTRPYLDLNISQENCTECLLAQTRIRGHFNYLQQSTVKISCAGALCKNPAFDLNFTGKTTLSYSGQSLNFGIALDLNSGITGFSFSDANISVEDNYFGVRVWN